MNLEELQLAGMNIESFRKRILNNESLIPVFIKKFVGDLSFEKLREAVHEENWSEAAEQAHALKGMCGNLSLDELYELFQVQLQFFRDGEYAKGAEKMDNIREKFEATILHMNHWLEQR